MGLFFRYLNFLGLITVLASCSATRDARTPGDIQNAKKYGYHPLDPLPVKVISSDPRNPLTNERILQSLPDETMRLAVGEFKTDVGLTFSTATTGYKGNSYVVILDYIKFNTQSFPVQLEPISDSGKDGVRATIISSEPVQGETEEMAFERAEKVAQAVVPVYIGVGLRLTANITVHKGEVNLGNLFALGAAASAEKISGTLVVQTLGLSGEAVTAALPMPSEINATTIQNAILALGTIKANIYDNSTKVNPRVVGVYNNIGGGAETINSFISSLLLKPKDHEVQ